MNGEKIKQVRIAQKLSLRDLAALTNGQVSFATISRFERGVGQITYKHYELICDALGVEVDRIPESMQVAFDKAAIRRHLSEIEKILED